MAVKGRIDAWSLMRFLVVPSLFLCAIFKHPIFQWLACAALGIWLCFLLSEMFRSQFRKRRRSPKKIPASAQQNPGSYATVPEGAKEDTWLSLLRQVNYRVMEQLKQSYPAAAWLWDTRPTPDEISKGCTKRIKLYHCDPFNFGEVTMDASGKLEIALIQLVALADADTESGHSEDLEENDILSRSDVKQWYANTGIALLSALIDELNVQGHKRLVIRENGDVVVSVGGKEQAVDTIPDFPPLPAWDDLCVLAREDDISAEVRGQELAVSWP